MTWYAELPRLRRRQVALDATVAVWVLAWAWVGRALHRAVMRLAAPGIELEEAGDGLAGSLGDAAGSVGRVPGVGGGLRAPLDAAASAGEALARAGQVQQDGVAALAWLLALVVAGLPVVVIAIPWLVARLRWRRDASAAKRLRGDVDLLALRAAATAPLPALAALGADPVTAWRRGDGDAGRALAGLELRRLGLGPVPHRR